MYGLYERSTKCNTKVLRKVFKQKFEMRVIMWKEGLHGSQQITIIPILMDFCIVREDVDVYEGDHMTAAMLSTWLRQVF